MKDSVEHLRTTFSFSERHACGLVGVAVSTFRYRVSRSDAALREQLIELAREKPRFGYRRLHVLWRRDGERVNHKRVWRVYREAGLAVKRRKRKTAGASGKTASGRYARECRMGFWTSFPTGLPVGVTSACWVWWTPSPENAWLWKWIPASPAAVSRGCWTAH